MPESPKLTRIPQLKNVAAFRRHLESLGIDLPCDEEILPPAVSPLAQPIPHVQINGKTIGNRLAVHPMEGWDGTREGGITENVRRRWRRFGESGAKLICGGEAMAVRPDGRANPNQLLITPETQKDLAILVRDLKQAHQQRYPSTDDLVVGFQLTHSGRFCRPHHNKTWEPRAAYRHPLLDPRFGVTSDRQVFTDDEIESLIPCFVTAARIAHNAGADFVDIKHCHGYLLHEFLSAFTRPGPFGGSFENRTRILRNIIAGIRADRNPIAIGVRLSLFDMAPFRPDPTRSQPGKPGPGIPEDFSSHLPYRYAFGTNPENPLEPDLTETFRFVDLCHSLGVQILNTTAGSPYYNPHIQRPAAYPPSDGYQPAYDPLIDVARQIHAAHQVRRHAPHNLLIVGTAYSYLQEFLPHVAQAVIAGRRADLIGTGRMMLSYPSYLNDAIHHQTIQKRLICRTFSDCTTAPRNGLVSGCYPLDDYYKQLPENQSLKQIKKGARPA